MLIDKELRRVQLDADTDLLHILEDVHKDKSPRLVERDGRALVIVISPEDYHGVKTEPTSKRRRDDLLALAGVWSDFDADRMIADVYEGRAKTPPSPPVEL